MCIQFFRDCENLCDGFEPIKGSVILGFGTNKESSSSSGFGFF
jgi:hypothetical protein